MVSDVLGGGSVGVGRLNDAECELIGQTSLVQLLKSKLSSISSRTHLLDVLGDENGDSVSVKKSHSVGCFVSSSEVDQSVGVSIERSAFRRSSNIREAIRELLLDLHKIRTALNVSIFEFQGKLLT